VPSASVDDILAAFRNTGQPVTDTRDWAPGTTTVPRIRTFKALATLTPITSPVPVLTSVDPPTARVGLPLTLTLTGEGFNALSVVQFNGVTVPTVADSITQLTASVPIESLTLGAAQVTVVNPAPGGGTSSAITIEVLPPPSLTVDQTTVGPGAEVTVTLRTVSWAPRLVCARVVDRSGCELSGVHVCRRRCSQPQWTVTAPTTAGPYEFRLS
jgi:hypothetical protein